MGAQGSVQGLAGIGAKKAEALKKLNIEKIEDLLFFYPRDYQDRREITSISELSAGSPFLIKAKITLILKPNTYYKKISSLKLIAQDESGAIDIVFFNAKYLVNSFEQDREYYFYGKVSANKGRVEMLHPEFSAAEGAGEPAQAEKQGAACKIYKGAIIPIYNLTAGISQHDMRKFQKSARGFIN